MGHEERDLVWTFLAVVAFSGAYALLAMVFFRNLTTVEVAVLLQTLCISCGVAGLLVLSLGSLRR